MELQLNIIGYLLIALALLHIILPNYFNWKTELLSVSLINKQIMYVHTFFIAFMVLLMGVLCVSSAAAIVHTALGRQLALGLSIFWGTRLIFQLFVYSPKLWKGKLFETAIHVIASIFWTYLCLVFFLTYWLYGRVLM